ncbi:hypothetical protein MGU_09964 [Metarhizium guizhouense ARSEF 977]|uniref:Uncharacterized protein n=1 Tax=Metarhizium guizhouense (strain ARSEF 977) TaxID=1276136 RepID=A0A0B4GSQ1_METGA|nr:hypothetical protein MGU_09964 [Metarhizium guizhouense ARSEF 977]
MESCALAASPPEVAYGVETGSEISVPAGNVADAFGQLENLNQLGRDVEVVAMEPFAVPDAGSTLDGLPQVTELLAFENDTCGVSSWQTIDDGIESLS